MTLPAARRPVLAVAALAVLAVSACRTAPAAPSPSAVVARTYSVCPTAGELPAPAVTDEAVEVIRRRLTLVGVETFSTSVGTCIEVSAAVVGDEAPVRAVVESTGEVELVPVSDGERERIAIGGRRPRADPIATGDDMTGVGSSTTAPGEADLTIQLSGAGSAALASWSRVHTGETLALVVDGLVVALPFVAEPITDGAISIQLSGSPPVPLPALEALIATGPLPPQWAQPERPQG